MERFISESVPHSSQLSNDKWKVCLAGGLTKKRGSSTVFDASGTFAYFRALSGHPGRNLINLSLQDNVVIPSNFFQYINHGGCTFNLNSVISSGVIPGGQSSSK